LVDFEVAISFSFTVGFSQWGRWQVRKSSVDDPYKYSLVEDLGPSLRAAYLEAEGDFQYFAGSEHLSLITDGVPWLFVITDSGKLYVKRVAAPLDTAILLDTDVLEASVCRGWKSIEYNQDAGLCVAYRKQSGVYVREYRKINNIYTWDGAQTITSQAVSRVKITRLNDYRMAILADDQIFLTERTYIGNTAKTEFFDCEFDCDFNVFAMCKNEGPKDEFSIMNVELKDMIELWVTGNYPFYRRDNNWNDLAIATQVVSGQGIDRYWVEDGLLKIRLKLALSTPYSYMKIHLRPINRIQFERASYSRPVCPELDIIYKAPPIPVFENLNVQFGGTSASIVMLQKRVLSHTQPEEYFETEFQGATASIIAIPIQRLSKQAPDEQFNAAFSGGSSSITMIQSSVTPI
jgi:hypothetical protein